MRGIDLSAPDHTTLSRRGLRPERADANRRQGNLDLVFRASGIFVVSAYVKRQIRIAATK
jgi:hypothetical protein